MYYLNKYFLVKIKYQAVNNRLTIKMSKTMNRIVNLD